MKDKDTFMAPPASDTPITDYLLGRQWGRLPRSGAGMCPECLGFQPGTLPDTAHVGHEGHALSCPLARALEAIGETVAWVQA